VRVQAAWLYLRHAKRLDAAIDSIASFASDPNEPAGSGAGAATEGGAG
jgi:hypothetical protein